MIAIGCCLFLLLDFITNKFKYTMLLLVLIVGVIIIAIGFPLSIIYGMFGHHTQNWIPLNVVIKKDDSKEK